MRYGLCKISTAQIRTVDAGTKALPLLKAAYDRGLNTVSLQLWSYGIQLCHGFADNAQWDTANVYSNGSSEVIIGRAIKKYNIPRHKLVICTKCCGTVRESNDPEVLALQDIDNTVDYVNQRGSPPSSAPHHTTAFPSTLTKHKIYRSLPPRHLRCRRRLPLPSPNPIHRPPPNPPLRQNSAYRRNDESTSRSSRKRESALHRRQQHVDISIRYNAVLRREKWVD